MKIIIFVIFVKLSVTIGSMKENRTSEFRSDRQMNQNVTENNSRQLQFQFLLDCALKNQKKNATKMVKTIPSTFQPVKFKPNIVTTVRPKITTKQTKVIKTVYMDPPVMQEVGDAFDNFYDFVEDSFYYGDQRTRRPKSKLNRINLPMPTVQPMIKSTRPSFTHRTTRLITNSPMRTTVRDETKNKNYLSTQIHVTSEYGGVEPTVSSSKNLTKPMDSEELDDDDYYYYENPISDISDELIDSVSYEDSEENNSEPDEYDDEYDDPDTGKVNETDDYPIQPAHKYKYRNANRRNSYKRQKVDKIEEPNYDDEDFFGGFFEPIQRLLPTFTFSNPFENWFSMDDNFERDNRVTFSRIDGRNPKRSKDKTPLSKFWLHNLVGSNEESSEELTTVTPTIESEENGWFDNSIFDFSDTESQENIMSNESIEESSSNSNKRNVSVKWNRRVGYWVTFLLIIFFVLIITEWFFGLFGQPTTIRPSTTKKPSVRPILTILNPLHNPQNWLAILASQMGTISQNATTKPTLTEKTTPESVKYNGYQVWRLTTTTSDQYEFLQSLKHSRDGELLQWWLGPSRNGPTDVLIPPNILNDIAEQLSYEGIGYEVLIFDLEKVIEYENPMMTRGEQRTVLKNGDKDHSMTWYRYQEYEIIRRYLEYLAKRYPNYVELIHIGRSFEGRSLIVMRISWNDNRKVDRSNRKMYKLKKENIFLESGTHGREWIGPAVSTWIIDSILKGFQRNDTEGKLIRAIDWYIMPVLNPDGYEYSHKYDRMWQKNRSKYPKNSSILSAITEKIGWLNDIKDKVDRQCIGTDLNQNWDYRWNEEPVPSSQCSESYAGSKPFSEPESLALSKFILENSNQIKLFISLQSYGQIISYPITENDPKTRYITDDLLDMANSGLTAIRADRKNRVHYTVDRANELWERKMGQSDSFALHRAGIRYAYTIHLRDKGTHAYLLPASYIEPTAKETFEMIKGMVKYLVY